MKSIKHKLTIKKHCFKKMEYICTFKGGIRLFSCLVAAKKQKNNIKTNNNHKITQCKTKDLLKYLQCC